MEISKNGVTRHKNPIIGISIKTEARSDADTLFAYTNHSYFNLDESEDAMNHEVKIHADQYGLSDANGLTLNKLVPVENTPFDFRDFKKLSKDINDENEQLKFGKGYDHHYASVWNNRTDCMSDYPRGSSENDSRALDRGGCRCFHGNPYEKLVG